MDKKYYLNVIETVARALEELLPEFTFIGGATLAIHIDDPVVSNLRPTDDMKSWGQRSNDEP